MEKRAKFTAEQKKLRASNMKQIKAAINPQIDKKVDSLLDKLHPSDIGMHLTSFALSAVHNALFPCDQLTPLQVAEDKEAIVEKTRCMLQLRRTS